MLKILRIAILLSFLVSSPTLILANSCNVVILGFDEIYEKPNMINTFGNASYTEKQFIKLNEFLIEKVSSKDLLYFSNIPQGDSIGYYIWGSQGIGIRDSYKVYCDDNSPEYLYVNQKAPLPDQANTFLIKLSAEKFFKKAKRVKNIKWVKPYRDEVIVSEKAYSSPDDLLQLIAEASSTRKKNEHPCRVAVLGFEQKFQYDITYRGERWLKIDDIKIDDFTDKDILYFDNVKQGSNLSFWKGVQVVAEADRYNVYCESGAPIYIKPDLVPQDIWIGSLDEISFSEFKNEAKEYSNIISMTLDKGRLHSANLSIKNNIPLKQLIELDSSILAKSLIQKKTKPKNVPQEDLIVVSAPAPKEPKSRPLKKKEKPKFDNKFSVAVVIGNAKYSEQKKGVPNVNFAHNDAGAIKKYLVETLGYKEENIIFVKDAKFGDLVSIFGIPGNEKGQLYDWMRPGKSEVFVYYSGHGAPSVSNGESYLMPVDADPQRIELSGYNLSTLYQNLSKLPAKNITVIMDACFSGLSESGAIVKNASSISLRRVEPEKIFSKATVLTAAGISEVASWDESRKHGLFTRSFLDGVNGAADSKEFGNNDGIVTLAELKDYLKEEVTFFARRQYSREQNPQVEGDPNFVMSTLTN